MIETLLYILAALWLAGSIGILIWLMTRSRAWWSNLVWWERSGLATVMLLWPFYLLAILAVGAHDWWKYR